MTVLLIVLQESHSCSYTMWVYFQNKNTESWRGVKQRQIGQFLIYLLEVQIKTIQPLRHHSYQLPTPVLGLFMDGIEVYI